MADDDVRADAADVGADAYGADIVPKDARGLRACMLCSLIQVRGARWKTLPG